MRHKGLVQHNQNDSGEQDAGCVSGADVASWFRMRRHRQHKAGMICAAEFE